MSPHSAEQHRSDIAIVGMSGRFPGARNVEEFWQNLRDGVESRTQFSDEDLAAEGVSLKIKHPRHVKAGFTLDDFDMFDSGFFGINPREAEILDPQHRLFLECSWHALENAGYDAERFPGVIGIFGGSTWSSYLVGNLFRCSRLVKNVGYRQLIHGSVPDYMVTRAAYRLNLRGPAYFIQSACSTSLVAIHLGCQSLLTHECDMVLAGGVSVAVPHRVGYIYEEGGMESPDGRVRAFDANAKGTVFGSGVALVVLRRLDDALRDGDCIHAVIKGSATNNDGSVKVGFTAPGVVGQAEVISHALANANVSPDEIDYVEAHGTGTELGDPIELAALTRAYSAQTARRQFCAVGSVKPNIGHLDAAAGVSSLIKTVLALQHGQMPPSINFDTLNPKIELDESPFYINTALREWTTSDGRPRRAGVSSFGFGGTNAHVVLEQAPPQHSSGPSRSHQLLLLSARTKTALDLESQQLANHLSHGQRIDLANVAYCLQTGRRQFSCRKAVVSETREDAVAALHGDAARWVSAGQAGAKERRIVFLFPGQGAQYVNMGRGLYDSEPVFRAAVNECVDLLQGHLGFDLRTVLYPPAERAEEALGRLKRTAVTQAAVFTIEFSLARLWMHWGIVPSAMVGHSIGEFVAACLSGVLRLEDALRLVATRGQLMESMPEGTMLAVPLPEGRVRELLADGLWLAAANSPSLCVASGSEESVRALERRLADEGVEGRRLHTSHAFHSGLMEGAADAFVDAVRSVPLEAPLIPYLSNVTGGWATDALVTDPAYWGRHIRETVRFSDNVAMLMNEKETLFLEVGPGNTLSTFVRQQAPPQDNHLALSSLRHPQEDSADVAVLLNALGRMWVAGVAVNWDHFYQDERRQRVPLPPYPFERTRHWIEADKPNLTRARRAQAMSQQDDLSDWFYTPSWKRSTLRAAGADPKATAESWVVFVDDAGVGDGLAGRLRAQGVVVSTVRPGESFSHDASGYTIDPGSASDYHALVKSLYRESPRPAAIAHLWGLGGDGSDHPARRWQDRGFYSLLYLAQALGEAGISSPLQLTLVASGLHDVTGEETLVPGKATALGPCRVIPLEFPNISCRSIDLQIADDDRRALVEALAIELTEATKDDAVAYRHGRRWVQTYEPLHLESAVGALSDRLRERGTYLITGGFGGIGLVLADYLARTRHCNLVLTGRRGLPPREAWAEHIDRYGSNDSVSRKILAVQQLEADGAQVFIGDADVSDPDRMRAVVVEACARFGRIDGVIHSAGVAGGGVIQLKKRDVADAVLKPKVEGTEVLGRLFEGQKLDFLVLCSSLTSVLGGVGQVDYCGANAYLDAFARSYAARTGTFTVAVNWTAWQEVGMAVETDMPDALKSTMRDQMLSIGLTNREGADAFARILTGVSEAQIAVSPLDVQLMLERMREAQAPEAQAQAEADANPTAAAGGHARPDLPSAYVEPRTDSERRLCTIWREMLGIAEIGVNDSFFDLGGHSLLAVRAMARINDVLHTEIPVAKLYEGLTIAFLARLVDSRDTAEKPGTDDQDSRERRREKARRQKEHQQRRLALPRR